MGKARPDFPQARPDERFVFEQGAGKEEEREPFPREHGDARAVYLHVSLHGKQPEQPHAQRRTEHKRRHIGKRAALRAQQAAEHQASAQRRPTQQHIARIGHAGWQHFRRRPQEGEQRGGEKGAQRAQRKAEHKRRCQRGGGYLAGLLFLSAAEAAADKASRAHAQREADGLNHRLDGETHAHGSRKLRVSPAENQRIQQRAQGRGQKRGQAGRGDAQGQAAHILSEHFPAARLQLLLHDVFPPRSGGCLSHQRLANSI